MARRSGRGTRESSAASKKDPGSILDKLMMEEVESSSTSGTLMSSILADNKATVSNDRLDDVLIKLDKITTALEGLPDLVRRLEALEEDRMKEAYGDLTPDFS